MTLAVGTALQNGTYAIDAWVTDDAVGPLYLAMDVPRGQWVQLRVLGSRHPETLPDASERQAFYRYLDQVNGLKHPDLPQRLGGFEEEGVCYQTFTTPAGTPLDRLIAETHSLAPRASLALIRHLIEVLNSLRPLGWAGLRLTPDQVWYAPETQALTFTGFDLVPVVPISPESVAEDDQDCSKEPTDPTDSTEFSLVKGLSYLLYFLLTGQRAEATQAPLAVELRRCQPALPTSLDAALEAGLSARHLSLAEWGSMLPDADRLPANSPRVLASHPTASVSLGLTSSDSPRRSPGHEHPSDRTPAIASATPSRRGTRTALALVFTGLAATASGLGFGLYTRLQPANSASSDRLNPNQSFPPLPDWNGDELWQPWDNAPTLRDRPDYGSTPPPNSEPAPEFIPRQPEPAAPPPVVAEPEPIPEPGGEPDNGVTDSTEPWTQPKPDPDLPNILDPLPSEAPTPAPAPVAPPAPLEAPPAPTSRESDIQQPVIKSPRPPAPAPASS